MFHQKLCTRCNAWAGTLSWWSCQSPFAHSCGLLNHLDSFCRGMFKLTTKFGADSCSTCSVILNAIATEYTCSFNVLYHPHWLIQWSFHCSHMHIPVHSPWLPAYINVTQTILVISTMIEVFLDRPYILTWLFIRLIFSICNFYNIIFPKRASFATRFSPITHPTPMRHTLYTHPCLIFFRAIIITYILILFICLMCLY